MRWRRRKVSAAAQAEADRVAGALEPTPLGGREVVVLELPGTDDVVLAVEIDAEELREAWAAARELVAELGRWPCGITAWEKRLRDIDLVNRHFYDGRTPADVLAATREVTPEDGLAWFVRRAPDEDDDAEPVEEDGGDHLEWFEPLNQPVGLAFLPTAESSEVPAYLDFFDAQGDGGHEALAAVLRGWQERFGAEVVASWGTMLQLRVARPPGTIEEATALAREQFAVASDTLVLPGVPLADHARALVGRTEWFLHGRP